MKLTKTTINKLKASLTTQGKLADALGISPSSIYRYIKSNEWDGPLTTETALSIMSKDLNIDRKSMLESKKVKA